MAFALGKGLEQRFAFINGDDTAADVGQCQAQRQTDVSGADHGNFVGVGFAHNMIS
ncbi:hypothetical protein D3C83_284770 [compost metagenome]